jgi:YesN/AraC family two-component response regulator
MNINTVRLFANRDNIYAAISGCETLEEIQAYMRGFFQDIHDYLGQDRAEDEKSVVRILRYLKDHYKEDISFDDMAKELNISYSYIRKMVRESTGKSVLDTINQMRIQEAKRLLAETNLTIAKIAGKSGYHNIQSINRFFKKYEGLTPNEYRMKK